MKINFDIFEKIKLKNFEIEKSVLKKDIKKIFKTLVAREDIKKSKIFSHAFNIINFEITFCDDIEIRKINAEFRKIDKKTDVITFALFYDDKNSVVADDTVELGEIIISLETAKEQAKIQTGQGVYNEVLTLVTHGILHLLGFDHQTEKDFEFVVNTQNEVLKAI